MRRVGAGLLLCWESAVISKRMLHLKTPGMNPKQGQLLDFDANLLHKDLREDFAWHLETALKSGVAHFVVPGSTLVDSAEALAFSKVHSSDSTIFATCGIHPYRTEEIPIGQGTLEELDRLVSDESCCGIGECGLDYSEGFPSRDFQIPWFEAQINLSVKYNKSLYLHIRDAHADFLSIMDRSNLSPTQKVCIHCFTGTTEELEVYARQRGYYISLSGHVLRKKDSVDIKTWLDIIPTDRLLLETDSPYMGFKGCRLTEATKKSQNYPNVPASLPQIAQYISASGGMPLEQLIESTTRNGLSFLGFPTT